MRPCRTSFVSPTLLVKKSDGTYRLVVDYRALNECLEDFQYPLPNNKDLIQGLSGFALYSKLDLKTGFHQVPLHPETSYLSSLVTPDGTWEYIFMSMGLKTAPAWFQYCMVNLFSDLNAFVYVFIDDIIIVARDEQEMLCRLKLVFTRLLQHRIRLNPDKCCFGVSEVDYLGFVVNAAGLKISPSRTAAILSLQPPTTPTGVRSFLGLINFFRSFIPNFAVRTKVFSSLTSGSNLVFNESLLQEFQSIKRDIAHAPLLHHINYDLPLFLATDASNLGVGGVLYQAVDKDLNMATAMGQMQASMLQTLLPACNGHTHTNTHVVQYVSKAFDATQQRWSTIEQEAYGIYFSVLSLRSYLLGHPFTVQTDHRNLTYLSKAEAPKIVRWRLALLQFDFNIVHVSGESNVVPDALSRCLVFRDGSNIVPEHLRSIMKFHNRLVGHLGVAATERNMRDAGVVWPSLHEDVAAFIAACPNCQKVRLGQPPQSNALHSTMVYEPFSVVVIDTIGPLPVDEHACKYIITIIDAFTRFTMLSAVPDASSMSAAAALLEFFGLFGFPHTLRSDQGTQFLASVIKDFLALAGVNNEVSIAYHHQPIVERENKEVMRALRAIIFDIQAYENWSVYLPLVQRIVNSSVSTVTGFSPADMVFGEMVNLDRSLLPAQPWGGAEPPANTSQYVKNMIEKQNLILKSAAAHQKAVAEKRTEDSPKYPTTFPVDSLVLVKYPSRPIDKLTPPWRGPMKVVSFTTWGKYTLRDLVMGSENDYHVSDLKAYNPSLTADPVPIAARDRKEFVIEEIVSHTGTSRRKTAMKFKVKWLGYDASYDSELSWHEVQKTEALQRYSDKHQLGF
jgi:hypothetical protein